MARIVVTGGSGKAGRAVVARAGRRGEDVLSADLVTLPGLPCEQVQADLTELGQAVEVLRGASAVVHLAAIPAPGLRPDELTFRVNTRAPTTSSAPRRHSGLERVVWASSETVLGLPFERERPAYAPIDEEHPPLAGVQLRAVEAVCQRRWRGSSTAGRASRSSACASRTSWSRTTTSGSPVSGTTRC